MSAFNKPLTVVEVLEECFDESLTEQNRKRFVQADSPQFNKAFDIMSEYHKAQKNYLIPQHSDTTSRPFVWHEMALTADRIGGNVFHRTSQIPRGQETANLRNVLLLHHQVMITDQLHLLLSALAVGAKTYSDKYEAYIDFLIANRPLIDNHILIITSDEEAYDIAPVNRDSHKYADPDISEHVRAMLPSEYEQERETIGRQVSRHLAYMTLSDTFDAEEFFDTKFDLAVYLLILDYWQVKLSEKAVKNAYFKGDIRISAEHLSNEDFINIRLNDDSFGHWREDLQYALAEETTDSFRDRMREGFDRVNKFLPPRLTEGMTKSFIYGLLTGVVTEIAGLPLLPATILGLGVETFDRTLRRKAEEAKGNGRASLRKHYSAMLENAAAGSVPQVGESDSDRADREWIEGLLKEIKAKKNG